MFLYTEKDLVDVLPLREKSFTECGIKTSNLEVICLREGTFAFLEIEDMEKYNSSKLEDLTVQSSEEREQRMRELKEIREQEAEEARKNRPEYKISELETKFEQMRASHSDLLLDLDFRVMDLEDQAGIEPVNILDLVRGGVMNSTFMVVLDKIETGNYKSREEIENICNKYLSRNRINEEEYAKLIEALEKKELEKTEVTE